VSDFFVGQVMMTGFGFAQKYFAQCNGQLMGIAQNQALFSLLGTTYGGDGVRTFALPPLQSRTPAGGVISVDPGWQPPQYAMGQMAGSENVTLLPPQLPAHSHSVSVTSAQATGSGLRGANLTLAVCNPDSATFYGKEVQPMPLGGAPLTPTGGSQPHPNIQPYETINFNIALSGVFPSRN
jgi:microcystin-dependent protein